MPQIWQLLKVYETQDEGQMAINVGMFVEEEEGDEKGGNYWGYVWRIQWFDRLIQDLFIYLKLFWDSQKYK